MVKKLVQRNTKIAAPLVDAKRRLRKGRRSQPFIGGVGRLCSESWRGDLPIAGEKQVNVSPTKKLTQQLKIYS